MVGEPAWYVLALAPSERGYVWDGERFAPLERVWSTEGLRGYPWRIANAIAERERRAARNMIRKNPWRWEVWYATRLEKLLIEKVIQE